MGREHYLSGAMTGTADALLLKYGKSGDIVREEMYNGSTSEDDAFYAVAIDAGNNICVTGHADSWNAIIAGRY